MVSKPVACPGCHSGRSNVQQATCHVPRAMCNVQRTACSPMQFIGQLLAYGCLSLAAGQHFNLPSLDLDTERLANATVNVASRYIVPRINTLVIRRDCRDCNDAQWEQQRQMVDQMLQQLAPQLTLLLYSGAPQEPPVTICSLWCTMHMLSSE